MPCAGVLVMAFARLVEPRRAREAGIRGIPCSAHRWHASDGWSYRLRLTLRVAVAPRIRRPHPHVLTGLDLDSDVYRSPGCDFPRVLNTTVCVRALSAGGRRGRRRRVAHQRCVGEPAPGQTPVFGGARRTSRWRARSGGSEDTRSTAGASRVLALAIGSWAVTRAHLVPRGRAARAAALLQIEDRLRELGKASPDVGSWEPTGARACGRTCVPKRAGGLLLGAACTAAVARFGDHRAGPDRLRRGRRWLRGLIDHRGDSTSGR